VLWGIRSTHAFAVPSGKDSARRQYLSLEPPQAEQACADYASEKRFCCTCSGRVIARLGSADQELGRLTGAKQNPEIGRESCC
jgi:hypothetical protein